MSKDECLNKYISERFMPYSTLQDDEYFKKCVSNTLSFNVYWLKENIKEAINILERCFKSSIGKTRRH